MNMEDEWMDVIEWRAQAGKACAGALTRLVEHPVPSQVSLHEVRRIVDDETAVDDGKKKRCPFALHSCRGAAIFTHTHTHTHTHSPTAGG